MAARSLAIRKGKAGVILKVRLTPKSSADRIEGVEDHAGERVLTARVRAVPEDGRANAALEALLAHWLDLPRSSVSVVRGGKSRLKQVAIDGDDAKLAPLIATRLAGLTSP